MMRAVLTLLYARTLPLLSDDKLPSRLVMLKWGANSAVHAGDVVVNETTESELPRLQALSNRERVALDFSHNTVEGTPFAKEPAKIAGYATPRVSRAEGLVFEDIEWTQEGRDAVLGGHYRELSAAVKRNEKNEVVWCHSGAICRHGQVRDLSPLTLSAADPFDRGSNPHTNTMNEKKLTQLLVTVLSAFVDVPETPTEEELDQAVEAFAAKVDGRKTKDGKVEEPGVKALAAQVPDLEKKVETLSADLKAAKGKAPEKPAAEADDDPKIITLSSRLDALEKQSEAHERAAITEKALREGKLIPLSANDLPLDQFRKIVDELEPDRVPLSRRTPEGVAALAATGAAGGQNSAVDERIRTSLGLTPEQWAKRNA